MNQIPDWQRLAQSFPCTARLISSGKLPENYQPSDFIELHSEGPLSTAERSVVQFLLHVWNRYEFSFELPEMMGWDLGHQEAFVEWANGRTLGRPLRYF